MAKQKTVFVLVHEHYHFPKDEKDWSGDLVAATPRVVVAGTPEQGDYLRIEAHKAAREQLTKHIGRGWEYEIKEGRTSNEYRVWVETKDPMMDRFVWVVREVEFR